MLYKANKAFLEDRITTSVQQGRVVDANTACTELETLVIERAKDTVGRQLKVLPRNGKSIFRARRQIKWAKMKDSICDKLRDDANNLVGAKEVVEKFYGELYSIKPTNKEAKIKWVSKIQKKVSAQQYKDLNKNITENNLLEAINELNNGKSPGSDGLGIEI